MLVITLLSILCFACSSRDVKHPQKQVITTVSSAPSSYQRARNKLSILARGIPYSQILREDPAVGNLKSNEELIDYLIDNRDFGKVVSRVLVDKAYHKRGAVYSSKEQLSTFVSEGKTIHFLNSRSSGQNLAIDTRKPCLSKEAILVNPWWKLNSQIWVCPDAYQPDLKVTQSIRSTGATCPKGSWDCSCGKNLYRCSPHAKTSRDFKLAGVKELEETVIETVLANEPVSRIFTRNDTVRDWRQEWQYERMLPGTDAKILEEIKSKFATPVMKARKETWPGQHAGVLTTPSVLYSYQDPRQRLREVYAMMWCSEVEARGATADVILSLGKNLQENHEGWQTLANKPICTNCHARLDYGLRFFKGFGDPRSPGPFVVKEEHLDGKLDLYGGDINDHRGRVSANPQDFANLAVSQPEFRKCMSRKTVEYVFGRSASSEDFEAVSKAYDKDPTAKNIFREALRRYADRWNAFPNDEMSAREDLREQLAEIIEEKCESCHSIQEPSIDGIPKDPDELMQLAAQVAFGRMPKDNPLGEKNKDLFVRASIELALPKDQRATTLNYFLSESGDHVGTIQSIERTMIDTMGVDKSTSLPQDWKLHEDEARLLLRESHWTASLATRIGLTALHLCRESGFVGAALADCVLKSSDPALYSLEARTTEDTHPPKLPTRTP